MDTIAPTVNKVKRKYTRKITSSPGKPKPDKPKAVRTRKVAPKVAPQVSPVVHTDIKSTPDIPVSPANVPAVATPPMASKKLLYMQLMDDLAYIMRKRGDPMRARAYTQARETMDAMDEADITSPAALKGRPGIGPTIHQKLVTFDTTGTLPLLEEAADLLRVRRALTTFTGIYGVGEKKAEELVDKGVTTLEELTARQYELLNDKQQVGLKYYHDILERIPRSEIDEYKSLFMGVVPAGMRLEIVGSYRRGAATSGDIDVILTSENPALFKQFIDGLKGRGIIREVLSCGNAKCLVVARLKVGARARRVDFLYTAPAQYPFALLYFTGSKGFNTMMREHALRQSYSLNEHELSVMEGRKKQGAVDQVFADEAAIFAFLGLAYRRPEERVDGRAVVPAGVVAAPAPPATEPAPVKKRVTKKKVPAVPPAVATEPAQAPPASLLLPPEPVSEPVPFSEPFPVVATEPAQAPPASLLLPPEPVAEPAPAIAAPVKAKKRVTKKKTVAASAASAVPTEVPVNQVIPAASVAPTPAPTDNVALAHIRQFQQQGTSFLKTLSEPSLAAMIAHANHAFHTAGEPVMTDAEYDILTQYVETRFPRSNAVQAIGALPVEKNKVRLPYEMASMDKIKPDTGALAQWKSTYTGPYVLSSKLDGVSGLFSTEDAAAPRLYTRGDGKIGPAISSLIPHLRLPTPAGAVVRGEFVFKKTVFADKYAAKYANARNLVAGLVNGKTLDDRIRDVDFVAYEVIRPASLTPSQQMAWLTEQGFQTVQHKTVPGDQLTNDQLSEHLRDARANEVYDIDRIIVSDDRVYPRTSGNPDHSFAFKMVLSDQAAETHVTDVEWTASKDGFLKPTVHVEPVTIGGVTIRKTTGFNAEFIEKNRLGVGAIVRLIRSGDVIPYIQQVVQPATQAKMPTVPYVWNKTHIDILLENADEDAEVRKKRIVTFFKTLDVDGLREGNVQKIVQAGYDTICKIVHMTEADMLKVEGFKEKTAHKLVTGIREAVAKAPIPALMVASGTMGRGMGEKKMEVVFEAYPEWLEPQERNLERLVAIKGMSRTTAQDLIMRIPAFMAFLAECGITLPSAEVGAAAAAAPVQATVTGPSAATAAAPAPAVTTSAATEALRNKTVVMTGVRSKELEAALKPLGVKFGSSVSKNTFALIVAAKGDALTGKMKDAQNLGIPMYTLEEFRTAFGIAA